MLNNFIKYNSNCPLCGNILSIYMNCIDGPFFVGKYINSSIIKFSSLLKEAGNVTATLKIKDNSLTTKFSEDTVFKEVLKNQIYFFYICQPKGIKIKRNSFEISLYSGCYYRSTPFFEFKKNNKTWTLEISQKEFNYLNNKDEAFSFHTQHNDVEKVYMMNLDYEQNLTKIFYYTVTDDQKKEKSHQIKIFEKTLPMLKSLPNLSLSARNELINRLDSWILMS